jgi:hypothetical protein
MDNGSDLKKSVRQTVWEAALGEKFKDIEGRTDSKTLGYERGEIASLPEGADMGLGCGTPLSNLTLKEGETVLDLAPAEVWTVFSPRNK